MLVVVEFGIPVVRVRVRGTPDLLALDTRRTLSRVVTDTRYLLALDTRVPYRVATDTRYTLSRHDAHVIRITVAVVPRGWVEAIAHNRVVVINAHRTTAAAGTQTRSLILSTESPTGRSFSFTPDQIRTAHTIE